MSSNPSPIKKQEKRVTSSSNKSSNKDSSGGERRIKKQDSDATVHITKVLSKTSIQQPSQTTTTTTHETTPLSTTTTSKPIVNNASIKILSKQLKFQNFENVHKLLSKTNNNFTVVGVIGGQSSGKSTLLSSLIKRSYDNNQPQNKNNTTTTPPSTAAAATTSNLKLFEIQTDNNFGLGKHQTVGIDLFISEEERIIYLDTQPIQSLSIMCDMIEDNQHLSNHYNSYEQFHHMQCLKLVTYLLSICNIVLIVQENKSLDIPLCKLIRTASLILKNKTPDVSNPTTNGQNHNYDNDILESTARQIFIFNKLTEIDTNESCFDKSLSVLFSNPKNLYQSFVSNLSNQCSNGSFEASTTTTITNQKQNSKDSKDNSSTADSKYQSMTHFDSFFISDKYLQEIANNATTEILGVNSSDINPNTINGTKKRQQQQTNTKLQPTFNESIEYLHKHLLLLRSVSKFTHEITERQWFENAQNLWNHIQDCDLLDSYNYQLSKSKYRPLNLNLNNNIQNSQQQHQHQHHHNSYKQHQHQQKHK